MSNSNGNFLDGITIDNWNESRGINTYLQGADLLDLKAINYGDAYPRIRATIPTECNLKKAYYDSNNNLLIDEGSEHYYPRKYIFDVISIKGIANPIGKYQVKFHINPTNTSYGNFPIIKDIWFAYPLIGKISDPVSVSNQITWDVTVSSGSGDFSYKWYRQEQGSSGWNELSSFAGATCTVTNYNVSFTIKCDITDNFNGNTISISQEYQVITKSGSLNQSETWSGMIKVIDNLTVPPGINLTINPGTTVLMQSGSSLIVNGNLTADGTTGSPVIINFEFPNADLHNGIIASPGSNIRLKNTNVFSAQVGVRAYDAGIFIDGCKFESMLIGLDLEYTYGSDKSYNSYVINSYINKCYESGIWIKGGVLRLENNMFFMNTQRAIRILNYSVPSLYRNTMRNNGYGMTVMVGSTALLFSSTGYGDNKINGTSFYGVLMQYDATLLASGGLNSFISSGNYHIFAKTNSNAQALQNYWGINIPNDSKFNADESSIIDYSDWLENDPGTGCSLPLLKSGTKTDLQMAYDEIMNSNYNEAAKLFKKVIMEKYDIDDSKVLEVKEKKNEARYALNGLATCYLLRNMDGFKSYLDQEIKPKIKDKKDENYLQYLEHYTHCLLEEGDYDEALANMKYMKENYKLEKERRKYLLFQEAFIQLAFKGNIEKCEEILTKIKSENSDSSTNVEAGLLISSYKMGAFEAYKNDKFREKMGKSKDSDKLDIPDKYNLFQNYPNPFNPTTTISYSLPFQSKVEVKIFDIMGNEIKTFYINSQGAGIHSLLWNGKNSNSEPVSSGIYIYRLKAVSFEDGQVFDKSAKMMLVK